MRNYSIDTLKLICAILVIYIHTPQPEIWETFITPIIRTAVPIFFMISGYFTYGKKNINKVIIKRIIYLAKILCWGFLLYALLFFIANGKDSLAHLSNIFTKRFILFNSVPYGMHLWYIFAYIYVLIIILFVHRFNLYKLLFYITPIILVMTLAVGRYCEITGISMHTRNFLFTGLPFFSIGMMIKRAKELPSKRFAIISSLIIYIISIFEVKYICEGSGDYYATTIPLSILIFILFLNIKQTTDNIFSKTGREDSLYIYLFHFIFTILLATKCNTVPYLPYYSAPLVFCLTMILIMVLRRLKIIGRII